MTDGIAVKMSSTKTHEYSYIIFSSVGTLGWGTLKTSVIKDSETCKNLQLVEQDNCHASYANGSECSGCGGEAK